MMPFIRSLSELTVLTESRDRGKSQKTEDDFHISTVDSAQRKRYINSIERKEVDLPDLPKILRHKWKNRKKLVSRFIDDLDYNNQIQSSYDLTLLDRQNNRDQEYAA